MLIVDNWNRSSGRSPLQMSNTARRTSLDEQSRMASNSLYYGDNLDIHRRYVQDESVDLSTYTAARCESFSEADDGRNSCPH